MVTLTDGTTVTASEAGADTTLSVGGTDAGRVRGSGIEVAQLSATLTRPGERATTVLVAGRRPVLRIDRAGRKATWFVLSRSRYRLSRLRPRPLLRRWVLTRDVEGEPVLRVSQSPLGTRVTLDETEGLSQEELSALVAGALAVVFDVPAEEAAGVRGR